MGRVSIRDIVFRRHDLLERELAVSDLIDTVSVEWLRVTKSGIILDLRKVGSVIGGSFSAPGMSENLEEHDAVAHRAARPCAHLPSRAVDDVTRAERARAPSRLQRAPGRNVAV